MTTTIQAIVFERVNEVGFGTFTLPDMNENQMLVKTRYTFVSSGTETRVLGGYYGAADKFPLIPGYTAVGEVVSVGGNVKGYRVGDMLSYNPQTNLKEINSQWGGQASMHLVGVDQKPMLLPKGSDPLDYVVSPVAAISLRGVMAAQPQRDECAVVIGQGVIGAFSAGFLVNKGCRVIAVDLSEARLQRSLSYGVHACVQASDPDALERILAYCDGGANIVVEASGSPQGVALAHKLIRKTPNVFRDPKTYYVNPISGIVGHWPRIVYQATYIDKLSLDPRVDLNSEGVLLLMPGDRGNEDRLNAIEAIRSKAIDPRLYIDRVVPYTEAAAAYEQLRLHPNDVFSVVFDWA
ncbi:zinc-binding dehydrogenase [Paenibacillus qinlingensis]|uniref:2-desacetyl-2-hydroxyethyl bacteriochlorophyllide A dehydrogenase n=1 Tax=Paenibacillus qinlingensis TaxID=1837343 RepID=A0ABU1NW73_9BACL|nr:zinc-binding dehydrogenase [Paenibacillus qinlingensis]MDR6551714.1 2-desacetyl-2-hydroxyethyl bacteriochlorophyllide A dehydrogenase [Paenibacillus qinlingensis]